MQNENSNDDLLWMQVEARIARQFDPEDLRTSGIISGRKGRWTSALLRLAEAAQNGLHDLQLLDILGEAAYRAQAPEILLPYQHHYQHPLIATHMARAHFLMGNFVAAEDFLRFAEDSVLKRSLLALLGLKNSMEDSMAALLPSPDAMANWREMQMLTFPEYWQALAVVADVGKRADLVGIAEERLKALAYDNPIPHYNQAIRLLKEREFHAGWRLYQARLHPKSSCPLSTECADISLWQGENLKGQTILIVVDPYGFGDQLFSLRFAKWLIDSGECVEIAVSAEVYELAQASFPEGKIHLTESVRQKSYWLGKDSPIFWCYALSVPAILGLKHPVGAEGFLHAPQKLTQIYAAKIREANPHNLPTCGIVWHGDTSSEAKRSRSYTLEEFWKQGRLSEKPRFIVNLQKDITPGERGFLMNLAESTRGAFLDASETLVNFAHTAAWISAIEEIISCDTSVAHLAGALGRPTTLLIRNTMIWQWICADPRQKSGSALWYQSAQIRHALTPEHSFMFDLRKDLPQETL